MSYCEIQVNFLIPWGNFACSRLSGFELLFSEAQGCSAEIRV